MSKKKLRAEFARVTAELEKLETDLLLLKSGVMPEKGYKFDPDEDVARDIAMGYVAERIDDDLHYAIALATKLIK